MNKFDPITLQILWNRLISTVDEAATTLIRTSFSTVVRESHDFACVLLDADGNSLAQSSVSVPSFLGTLPITVKHFLDIFGKEGLHEDDVLITNDPWKGSGHLPDISMARPIFKNNKLIAFAATIAHSPDIGGKARAVDSKEIYEEGLFIPPMKIINKGELNEDLLTIIRKNVRVPDQVIGDLFAQMSASDLLSRRLIELIEEYNIGDLNKLSETIQQRSEIATKKAIKKVPDGEYFFETYTDGIEGNIKICIKIKVEDSSVYVDYTGSSQQIYGALNTPLNYTYAFTIYALKCLIAPDVPNNEGCFRPFEVYAPEGTVLNPKYPAAVTGRVLVGHVLPSAVFGALSNVLPNRIAAASGAPIWSMTLRGEHNKENFSMLFFLNCGQGAMQGKDGMHCLSWPSNISNTPIEVIESRAPVLFIKKGLSVNSGGSGQFRGGSGQEIELVSKNKTPIIVSFFAERIEIPAFGLLEGKSGGKGGVYVNGIEVSVKKEIILQEGDSLQAFIPGGGGIGNPLDRDFKNIEDDLRNGVITPDFVEKEYQFKTS